jgi:PAS domain S-box-containing protein
VFVVPDAAQDSRFATNPLVTGPPHIRFYAGAPIRSRENLGLGTLCILDTSPRVLSAGEAQLLRALADQAAALLDLRRRTVELTAQLRSELPPAFAASASRESAAINHSADVLTVIDLDGTIVYANNAVRTVLGFDPMYWVGRSAMEAIHPQDLELASRLLAESGSISGAHRPFTIRIRRADGSWCSMEFVSTTISGVPALSGIVLNGRDVSGRADSRETILGQRRFLELALDNVSEGVIACDGSGVLTEFNLAARRLHGQAGRALPAAEWAGTYNLRTADGKRQLRLGEIPLYRALLGEHVVDAEIQIAPSDETPRLVRCTGQPLRNDRNEIVGAVLAMREVVVGSR